MDDSSQAVGVPPSGGVITPGDRARLRRKPAAPVPPNGRTPAGLALFMALFLAASVRAQEWHTGLSQASVDATVSFPVGGIIAKILKKENEPVKAGEVILELENELETLEVERQKLAVAASFKEYERTKKVFDKGGSVSEEDVEQKEAVWLIAQVEQQQAEAQLRRRSLPAPTDGIVVDLFDFDRGEAVTPNAPVARVLDMAKCRFIAHVRGDSPHGMEKGKAIELRFKTSTAEITVEGTVEFVSLAIDAASGLQEVRAVFDNLDHRVPAGLLGKMRLKTAP